MRILNNNSKTIGEPLFVKYNMNHNIGFEYLMRVRYHDDEISIILKGHLLVEYLLNRILTNRFSNLKTELTFNKKVKLLSNHGLLEENITKNIRLLNLYRNKLAHELDYIIHEDDMIFYKLDGEIITIKPKKGRIPQRYYYRMFCLGILTQITNHMMFKINIDPRWLEENQ